MSALSLWKNKSSERSSEKAVSPAAVTSCVACIHAIPKVSVSCKVNVTNWVPFTTTNFFNDGKLVFNTVEIKYIVWSFPWWLKIFGNFFYFS